MNSMRLGGVGQRTQMMLYIWWERVSGGWRKEKALKSWKTNEVHPHYMPSEPLLNVLLETENNSEEVCNTVSFLKTR